MLVHHGFDQGAQIVHGGTARQSGDGDACGWTANRDGGAAGPLTAMEEECVSVFAAKTKTPSIVDDGAPISLPGAVTMPATPSVSPF